MGFQITEKLKEYVDVSKIIKKYDTNIYIYDNPLRMFVERTNPFEWEHQHDSFKIRLVSLGYLKIEDEEHYSTFSDAINKFNEIKKQYGKR